MNLAKIFSLSIWIFTFFSLLIFVSNIHIFIQTIEKNWKPNHLAINPVVKWWYINSWMWSWPWLNIRESNIYYSARKPRIDFAFFFPLFIIFLIIFGYERKKRRNTKKLITCLIQIYLHIDNFIFQWVNYVKNAE